VRVTRAIELTSADRSELAELVRQLSVVRGHVVLSSGKESNYYVDLRRATLHHRASRLIGTLMRELTNDWDYLDPVATAIMHAPGRPIDAFVVRKSAKTYGMQRQIEGFDVVGQRVLVVEDTSTTGASPLAAVRAVREAGGDVIGVATVVDRATGAAEIIEAEGLAYRSVLELGDLGLADE
jgi:orotate phosphoribosyltransferase